MVNEVTSPWPSENIPDNDLLYMRVFHIYVKGDRVSLSVFKNMPTPLDGMSTDWSRYSTPATTRAGGNKPPADYHVIKMLVGSVRQIPNQIVEHTPDWEKQNRAHTDVWGNKNDEEVRVLFGRVAELIPLAETEASTR